MKEKKGFFSIGKKAQVAGTGTYKWVVKIILGLMLALFLFMMLKRWTDAVRP